MRIHFFAGTHWDREWYRPFQGFRSDLVSSLNGLVEAMEAGALETRFHLDGQSIVLEDYTELCPENAERLKALIAQGRVLAGPWYCMPDEMLVSGEALIRNLQLGHRLVEEAGGSPWKCGYVCDIFGHTAQFPRLLNGFGIQTCVLGRGTNEHDTPSAFLWQAPGEDAAVTTLKLPDADGYGAFSATVCGQQKHRPLLSADSAELAARLRAYVEKERARTGPPLYVLWDAMDHEPFHKESDAYVRTIRSLYPDAEVVAGDLLESFDWLEAQGFPLESRQGELYEPAREAGSYLHLLSGTLSSRPSLKRRNDSCQSLLEKRLEPLMTYDALEGRAISVPSLELAWQHLLQNQPHDSICGCSLDQVHEDMLYRYSQVESLVQVLTEQSAAHVTGALPIFPAEGGYLQVFNPLSTPVCRPVTVTLPLSPDFPTWEEPFGYEKRAAFLLLDSCGKELAYSTDHIRRGGIVRVLNESHPAELYTVTFMADLPALGTASFRVAHASRPVRQRSGSAAGRVLDNSLLRVTVNAEGTLDLLDYQSGQSYSRLLELRDSGELGDGWNSIQPAVDEIITGGTLRQVAQVGPHTLRVKKTMKVPACVDGYQRSAEAVELPLTFHISLYPGQRQADVRLSVDNCAKDHVLELLLPTGIPGP